MKATKVLCVVVFLMAGFAASGQTQSNRVNPNWNTLTHWSLLAPGYDMARSATLIHNSTVTTDIIVKSNYVLIIEAGVLLSTNATFTVKENATLIVRGTLRGTNASKEFKVEGNGKVIIEAGGAIDWAGKFTANDNTVQMTIDGVLEVDDDFDNKSTITGTGSIVVGDKLKNHGGGKIFGCTASNAGCCTGSPCSMGAMLPVTLLSFDAAASENIVALRWSTTMEENFLEFVVQRAADGLSFEDIGTVKGQGFDIHDIVSRYSFIDAVPAVGHNYYRLKAVDLDDSFEYFEVKVVQVAGAKKVAVYPNPTTGEKISFRTNFTADESDVVVLMDQMGNELFRGVAAGLDNMIAFSSGLRSGTYVLRYISAVNEQTQRVVVRN